MRTTEHGRDGWRCSDLGGLENLEAVPLIEGVIPWFDASKKATAPSPLEVPSEEERVWKSLQGIALEQYGIV
jgi:hypothetical protein